MCQRTSHARAPGCRHVSHRSNRAHDTKSPQFYLFSICPRGKKRAPWPWAHVAVHPGGSRPGLDPAKRSQTVSSKPGVGVAHPDVHRDGRQASGTFSRPPTLRLIAQNAVAAPVFRDSAVFLRFRVRFRPLNRLQVWSVLRLSPPWAGAGLHDPLRPLVEANCHA